MVRHARFLRFGSLIQLNNGRPLAGDLLIGFLGSIQLIGPLIMAVQLLEWLAQSLILQFRLRRLKCHTILGRSIGLRLAPLIPSLISYCEPSLG